MWQTGLEMKRILKVLATFIISFFLLGCQAKTNSTTLTIACASSLQKVFETELISMFNQKYPDICIEATYDSSGKLQQQILNGLEADLFFSAAKMQVNDLKDQDLVHSSIDLLENQLVVVTSKKSSFEMKEFKDILNAEIISIGDINSVPAGMYAKEALEYDGIFQEVLNKASFGLNVIEVLNQVIEGSAEVGIVYKTDAMSRKDEINIAYEIPSSMLNEPVIYPVCIFNQSTNLKQAELLMSFLQSPEAILVFEQYGFIKYN